MSARTATQAMAATRLDGDADEHGNDAVMDPGDAVRVLDKVVRDAWKVGWGGTIEEVRNAVHIRNNPAQG